MNDTICKDIQQYIRLEWPLDISGCDDEVKKLYQVRDSLILYGDIIMYE
jgi:hypothetical protein